MPFESSLERRCNPARNLVLESRFSMASLGWAGVRLVGSGGAHGLLELGQIDVRPAVLQAPLTGPWQPWELEVDGGPGHRDFLTLPVQGGPRSARSGQWKPPCPPAPP